MAKLRGQPHHGGGGHDRAKLGRPHQGEAGDPYSEYVRRTGSRDLAATSGNRGVYLLRRREGRRRASACCRSGTRWRGSAGSPERIRSAPATTRGREVFLKRCPPASSTSRSSLPSGGTSRVGGPRREVERIGRARLARAHPPKGCWGNVGGAARGPTRKPGGHTIWELVLHVTAGPTCSGGGSRVGDEEPPEGDYPAPWAAPHERVGRRAAALSSGHEAPARGRPPLGRRDLDAPVPGPTLHRPLPGAGAVRHIVYHSGQIGLLKKATSASG